MSVPMKERRTKRAYDPEGTRGRILDAAANEFQHRGYHATSMHDIMRIAQVPGGSIYHHFPTKKSLPLPDMQRRNRSAIALKVLAIRRRNKCSAWMWTV